MGRASLPTAPRQVPSSWGVLSPPPVPSCVCCELCPLCPSHGSPCENGKISRVESVVSGTRRRRIQTTRSNSVPPSHTAHRHAGVLKTHIMRCNLDDAHKVADKLASYRHHPTLGFKPCSLPPSDQASWK